MPDVAWLLVLLAFVLANIPWFTERFVFFIKPASGKKKVWMCLLEIPMLYCLMGFIAIGVERKMTGEIHRQDWEFYWVSFFLFLILSVPGFIYRYQLRHYLK